MDNLLTISTIFQQTYYIAPKGGKLPNAIRNKKSRDKLKASFGQPAGESSADSSISISAASNLNKILKTGKLN